jgi:hypothetical protein
MIRRALPSGAALTLAVLFAATQSAPATGGLPRCSLNSLRLVMEKTEGAAEQAVAFLDLVNRGAACRLSGTATMTVARNGATIGTIRNNPVTYPMNRTVAKGTTMLLNVWWMNWCGQRNGAFRVQGTLGQLSASGRFNYLPVCIHASAPSRLTGSLLNTTQ